MRESKESVDEKIKFNDPQLSQHRFGVIAVVAYFLHVLLSRYQDIWILFSGYTIEHCSDHPCFSVACQHGRHLYDHYYEFHRYNCGSYFYNQCGSYLCEQLYVIVITYSSSLGLINHFIVLGDIYPHNSMRNTIERLSRSWGYIRSSSKIYELM